MREMPYAVPYEYVPVSDPNIATNMTVSYSEICYQVSLKKYDAMVGDTTITINRSLYVDFTLPYTESGVQMLVPMKENCNKSFWIFLKPIDPFLWIAILIVFLATGVAIWAVERESRYFRGSPGKQFINVAYFSFQAILTVPRDPKLKEWLSKFALINFLLLFWLLEKLYSANLTSMMTVRQLQPTVADLNQLIASGDYVGYQSGSFAKDLLKSLNVDESKIRSYRTDQYAEALMKGSRNGGVAAIFDEIPYLKLFMSKNCSNHSVLGPVYNTGGFGFVFPKGSPLVVDVSRAILKVTEGDDIVSINRRWLGDVVCTSKGNGIESEFTITLESLRGVFFITIGLWILAGIIYAVMWYLRKRRGQEERVERPVAELTIEHVHNEDIDESVNWPISKDTHLIIRLRGNPSRQLQTASVTEVELRPVQNGGEGSVGIGVPDQAAGQAGDRAEIIEEHREQRN